MSEHELLTQLDKQGVFDAALTVGEGALPSSNLALFQKHFLIMNALYHLQEQLLLEHLYLSISPLKIVLMPVLQRVGNDVSEQDESPALKAYYSDLTNLEETDEQGVEDLLNGFWQRYIASDKRVEAYQVLELPAEATWDEVKKTYRRLAKIHHPDHGGEQDKFVEVRAAFEVLQQSLNR